jgi:hypothetical protein
MQSFDAVQDYSTLIQKIHAQYIAPYKSGLFPLGSFSAPTTEIDFTSMTFRGEESLAQILRSVSDMCYGASYGIDADRNFFFIPRNETKQASYIEDADLQSISRSEDRSLMFNRMILVGGYVYGEESKAGFFRWVSTHFDEASMNDYGAKQLRIYLPWVRTPSEASNYAVGFFEKYAGPTQRYTVTTVAQGGKLLPWMGFVELLARTGYSWAGETAVLDVVEQVDVSFNEMPTFSFTTGPEELQYPQEPEAQRWEMPDENGGGGDLNNISDGFSDNLSFSFSSFFSSEHSTNSYVIDPPYSEMASSAPSERDSDYPSDRDSNFPSENNSDAPSENNSNYPSERDSDFPSEGNSDFPSPNNSDWPSENASNFPSSNNSHYPSSHDSNYPSFGSNLPTDGVDPDPDGCEEFVCDVTVDGCTITVTKSTATEAGTKMAAAMEASPVLAARIALALQPYL